MSVAEFSSLLQDQAYKSWFRASNTNVLNKSVTELREYEESSAKTDFIITKNTVADVIEKLTNKNATEEQITKVIERLKITRPKKVIEIHENKGSPTDTVTLKFSRLNLKQIGDVLNQGFKEELEGSDAKISDFFQRGHVFGVATNLVKQTRFGVQQSKLTIKQKQLLIGMLDEYISVLEKDDLATSNIRNPEHQLYAKYSKNYRRYLVELQPKTLNQDSGRSVAPITASLRKYFKPENYVLLSKSKLEKDNNTFFSKLVTTKGSPSMLDLMVDSIVSTLKGVKHTGKTYVVPNVKVYSKKIEINAKQANIEIKQAISEAKALKQKIASTKTSKPKLLDVSTKTSEQTSLANLQLLLNTHLQSVISANMGGGSDKRILNYRTGRFAASASVEKLTMSKDGMISAFYSYMKNPYATFSQGGAQQFPKTRDPKLLISQSIREIAATAAVTRLRAVAL